MFERLLIEPPYSLKQADKEPLLLEGLNELTRYHYEKSPEYRRIIDAAWGGLKTYGSIAEVPYLPVSLFKEMELKSTVASGDGHALERHHRTADEPHHHRQRDGATSVGSVGRVVPPHSRRPPPAVPRDRHQGRDQADRPDRARRRRAWA